MKQRAAPRREVRTEALQAEVDACANGSPAAATPAPTDTQDPRAAPVGPGANGLALMLTRMALRVSATCSLAPGPGDVPRTWDCAILPATHTLCTCSRGHRGPPHTSLSSGHAGELAVGYASEEASRASQVHAGLEDAQGVTGGAARHWL